MAFTATVIKVFISSPGDVKEIRNAARDVCHELIALQTEQSRMLVVEAEVGNDGHLRPGSFARADIVTSDSGVAVTVPTSAITTFAGIEKVIVVQNGKALEKPVTTGRRAAEWTEVVSGVNLGDSVVVEPGNLQSGQAVNVVE